MKSTIKYFIITSISILNLIPKPLNSTKYEKTINYTGLIEEWQAKSPGSKPDQIKIDPFNHNIVWFTQPNNHSIARFDYTNSTYHEFKTDSQYRPDGLVIDKNGVLWFGEQSSGAIGSFDPITEKFTHHLVPYEDANPAIPTVDKKGNVWISDHQNNKIIILNTKKLKFKIINLPTHNSWIVDLKEDSKQRMWYSCYMANRIGFVYKNNITEYILPIKDLGPSFLTLDKKGNVWISLWKSNKIARFDPINQKFSFYIINIKNPGPAAITFDPKYNRIFLSTKYLNSILMLNITNPDFFYSFPIPTKESGQKDGICVDVNGIVWFTQFDKNKFARLDIRKNKNKGLKPKKIKAFVKKYKPYRKYTFKIKYH